MVSGKSKSDIIGMFGNPINVSDGIGSDQIYDYSPSETYLGRASFTVSDDETGLIFRNVTIIFGPDDIVKDVNL
jgi:hypothetical protein